MFKTLHRTRMVVFKDDDKGLTGELCMVVGFIPDRRMSVAVFAG